MIDVVLVLAFAAYAIASGVRARRRAARGPVDYFLGGREIRGWRAGLSMAATQYAADTPLAVTGLVATAGVFALWRFWVYSIAFLLMGFVLAPGWRRSGVITDAELCELRYGGRAAEILRYVKALYFGTFVNCVVLAMVMLAATRITEPFLLWHEWLPEGSLSGLADGLRWYGAPVTPHVEGGDVWLRSASNVFSLLVIAAFTLAYSATGGLRSVVATDVVQISIALLGTAIYAWVVVDAVGGIDEIVPALQRIYGRERAAEIVSFDPTTAAEVPFAIVALLSIQWLAQVNADGTGYLAQRSMATPSDRDARIAALVFTWVQSVLRTLLWLPIVVGLLILYPAEGGAGAAEREAAFVWGIRDHLAPGARGLMLVGLLAALASTLDTHLNWGASYWTNDIYRRLFCERIRGVAPSARAQIWVARGSNVLILALGLVVMLHLDSIQEAWRMSLLVGAGIGVPLLLRWVWHGQTAQGELAATVASVVFVPLFVVLFDDSWFAECGIPADGADALRLIVMGAVGGVAAVAASLVWPDRDGASLRFYRRVRPVGFWGAAAAASGDDPREVRGRLVRGVSATILGAGSVFAAIIALGVPLLGAARGPGHAIPWLVLSGVAFLGSLAAARHPTSSASDGSTD